MEIQVVAYLTFHYISKWFAYPRIYVYTNGLSFLTLDIITLSDAMSYMYEIENVTMTLRSLT